MRHFILTFTLSIALLSGASTQLRAADEAVVPAGAHLFELQSQTGAKRTLAMKTLSSGKAMEVSRAALLALPMEFFAMPTDLAKGEFVEPGKRVRENVKAIKLVLKLSGKVISKVSEKSEMLQDFVDRTPTLHPTTGKEVTFKEYLQHYVAANDYVKDGYFKQEEVNDDPASVFLRLLMFDKWVLYEAKLIHGKDGSWYSMEDALKGHFKDPYAQRAVGAMKNAMKFQGEAKALPTRKLISKGKAYTGALASYLNTCLYIVEANRERMLQNNLTAATYENIRGAALKAKLMFHYRTPMKVIVVD